MSLFEPFQSGTTYLARCGEPARIERRAGHHLYGKVYRGQIKMCWNLDGTQFPGGGSGPYDLIRPNRSAPPDAPK